MVITESRDGGDLYVGLVCDGIRVEDNGGGGGVGSGIWGGW